MRGIRTRLTAVGVAVSALFGAFHPGRARERRHPSGAVGPFCFVNIQNGRCLDEPYFAGGAPNGPKCSCGTAMARTPTINTGTPLPSMAGT